MTFTLATAPVSGGAGLALTASGVTSTFDQALRDESPSDLRLAALKRMLAMGCDRATADGFLNNTAFSPSVQTAIVLHLDAMDGVENRAAFIQLAGEQSASEGDALFFSETSRILAQLHTGGRTLARLETLGSLPVALSSEGNVIVALEWDYAAWTQNAANFIEQLKTATFGGKAPSGIVVALSGDASPMVKKKLSDAAITFATRLAPGPLQ